MENIFLNNLRINYKGKLFYSVTQMGAGWNRYSLAKEGNTREGVGVQRRSSHLEG